MRRSKGGSGWLKAIMVGIGGLALWQIFKPSDAGASTPKPDPGPVTPPFPTTQSLVNLVPSKRYVVEFHTPADFTTEQVVNAFTNAGFSEIYPSTPLSQFNSLRWQVTARWVSPADHTTLVAPFSSLVYRLEEDPPVAA